MVSALMTRFSEFRTAAMMLTALLRICPKRASADKTAQAAQSFRTRSEAFGEERALEPPLGFRKYPRHSQTLPHKPGGLIGDLQTPLKLGSRTLVILSDHARRDPPFVQGHPRMIQQRA